MIEPDSTSSFASNGPTSAATPTSLIRGYDSPIAAYLFAYAHREKALGTWLFIATLNESNTGLSQYCDASRLLDLNLRGAGGGDWAGHSLQDGRVMYGELPIREESGAE